MLPLFGTIITWTATDTDTMFTNVGTIVDDFVPMIVPILAVAIGLLVLGGVFALLRSAGK